MWGVLTKYEVSAVSEKSKRSNPLFSRELQELSAYFECPSDPRLTSGNYRKTEDWLQAYRSIAEKPAYFHDEPWLTITALYGLLGDQTNLDSQDRIKTVNDLFERVFNSREGSPGSPRFSTLSCARMEVFLRENTKLRKYLNKTVFHSNIYHPYKDRRSTLKQKLERPGASLEGNTHIDAVISGTNENGELIHVFIEAKFMSDISTTITYLPIRNQIARNIDCILDVMTGGGMDKTGIENCWFVLLTPGMFRTAEYGGPASTPLDSFQPTHSRLYCFKMNDYLNPTLLKGDLPHWKELSDEDWAEVSKRIGWMSFEESAQAAVSADLVEKEKKGAYIEFFRERMLYP